MQKSSISAVALVFSVLILFLSQAAFARSDWLNPRHEQGIYMELNRPQLHESIENTTVWTLFASGEIKVARTANLVFEIPWIRYSISEEYYFGLFDTESSSIIGNPYIGIVSSSPGSSAIWEVGARLPIVGDNDEFAAIVGSIVHWSRLEAYIPDHGAIRIRGGYRYISPSQLIIIFKAGPMFTIPMDSNDESETEAFADFDLQVWAPISQFMFGVCLNNRYILTEDPDEAELIDDRLYSEFVLAANATLGQFRPGVHLSLPIDDLTADFVDLVIGVDLVFYLTPR